MNADVQTAIVVEIDREYTAGDEYRQQARVTAKLGGVYPNGDEVDRYGAFESPLKELQISAYGRDRVASRGFADWDTVYGLYSARLADMLPVVAAFQKIEAALGKGDLPDTFADYLTTVAAAIGAKRGVLIERAKIDGDRTEPTRRYFRSLDKLGIAVQKAEAEWQADAAKRAEAERVLAEA